MIKYGDLVEYIKANHINWNTDLFDVLKGFFNQYSPQTTSTDSPIQQRLIFENWTEEVECELSKFPPAPSMEELNNSPFLEQAYKKFIAPANGEYTSQDLINLFST